MALNLGYRVSFLAGYYQHIANILVSQLRKLQEGNPDENAATMARALHQIEKLKAECVTYEQFCGDIREQIIKVGLGLCVLSSLPFARPGSTKRICVSI